MRGKEEWGEEGEEGGEREGGEGGGEGGEREGGGREE